jgi:hypothetical protein
MSTTTTEWVKDRTSKPRQRTAGGAGTAVPAPRDPGGAVSRAYARRAGRRERLGGVGVPDAEGRSRFVLMIMVMLGAGLIASLWLSTTAAADSYRLDVARQSTRDLTERIEIAQSQIDAMQSPPAIARAAASLGMVQVADVARLIVGPDGHVTVFGTPEVAVAAPVPAPVAQAGTALPGAKPNSSPTDRMTPEHLVALQAQQDPDQSAPAQPESPSPGAPESQVSQRAEAGTGR